MPMIIRDLIQRTPEWFTWRSQGVTASEAPIIAGITPYKTAWRLWAERTGIAEPDDLSGNPNVQYGVDHEDDARAWAEEKLDTVLLPVCGESSSHPILRASFDGITDDGIPVEIKCPHPGTFAKVAEQGEDSDTFRFYRHQVLHQVIVAMAPYGYLVFWRHDVEQPLIFKIMPDPAECAEMIEDAELFWSMIENKQEPAKDAERDLFQPDDMPTWNDLALRYADLTSREAALKAELKLLETDRKEIEAGVIAQMGDYLLAETDALKVTRFHRAGSIDYGKALKTFAPDVSGNELEAFRKKGSNQYRITVPKPRKEAKSA